MIGSIQSYVEKKQGNRLPCFCFTTVDSTNRLAKEYIADGKVEERAVFIAHTQTSGRGRYDRSFLSPKGGVYLTYVRKVPAGADFVAFGLYSALAVANVLSTFVSETEHTISVKWPNDVQLDGKKIAGILPESVEKCGERFVIVGIGVNVDTKSKDLKSVEIATSLRKITGKRYDVKKASAMLCVALSDLDDMYFGKFNDELCDEYNRYSSTVGKIVTYTSSEGKTAKGKAVRVEKDGSLVVLSNGREERVIWGEIVENA